MAVALDIAPGGSKTDVQVTGVAAPGSGIGVRVLVDDTLITSIQAGLLGIATIEQWLATSTWPIDAVAPVSTWILATGFWNDAGVWDDAAVWID